MSKKLRENHINHNQSFLPRGLLKFFAVAAFFLVPWTILLSQFLPPNHFSRHWDVAWSGFDFSLLVFLGLTAYLGLRKSGWVIIPASICGIMLFVDAWFDCLTAKQGEYLVSLSSAVLIEVPMGFMAFWIAYCAGKHYLKKK